MTNSNSPLGFAVTTAKEAGEILLKYFGTNLTKKIKTGPSDYATEADEASEKLILAKLAENLPDDAIVTEESGSHGSKSAEYTWIIDPLDGTHNFAQNKNGFGVLIARARNENIVLAVAYDPVRRILATAQQGKGMFLNDRKSTLSQDTDEALLISANLELQPLLASIGEGDTDLSAISSTLSTLQSKCKAYASNAGFIWDFAVPYLLFAEAGWKATDFKGDQFHWTGKVEYGNPGVIAAPPDLHEQILSALRSKPS